VMLGLIIWMLIEGILIVKHKLSTLK